jgi:hypothetical protein
MRMPDIDVPILNSEYSVCVIWDEPPDEVEKRIRKFYPETRFDVKHIKGGAS